MTISRDDVVKHADIVLAVLQAVTSLAGDKRLAADLVIDAIRAALGTLDSGKIGSVTPDEIRAMAKRLRDDLAARDADKDAALRAKFDTSDVG